MERLSTGKRINSASDDAAGVAIASRLTSEIKGTNQAIRNAQDGQALIDTAEGAHKEVETILQRMRELAVQSSNDTNDTSDRANLQAEFSALATEINRIAGATTWAGQDLLTGAGGTDSDGAFNIQVGGNTGTVDTITVTIGGMTTSDLGEGSSVDGSVGTAGVDEETQVTNVALDVDNVATIGDTTTLTVTDASGTATAISYTAVASGETLATIVAGLNTAATAASYTDATFSAGSDGVSIDVTYAATGAQTDTITLAALDNVTAAVQTTGLVTQTNTASVYEITNVALDVTGVSGIGDTVTFADSTGTATFSYTTLAANEEIATILAGLQAAAITASYSTATLTLGSDGASIDVTNSAFSVANGTITLDATDIATAAVSTTGSTTTTGVTAIAQISSVDASDFEVEEGDVFTMVVGDVTLTYTASSTDTAISDVVTGLQTDDDYDATVFVLSESSDTITATYTDAGVQDDTTITISKNLFDVSDRDQATAMIDLMDAAIATVNTQRAELGATSNRLDNTVNNLTSISIQLEGGRGRIEDADFAAESTSLAKSQILQQASTAMLAQANASKQSVLSLLQG
jgi:flagellin